MKYKLNEKSRLDSKKQIDIIKLYTDARNIFLQNFMSKEYYSLGEAGRNKINNKLKLSHKTKSQILRPEDILATIDYLINLDYGTDF